MTIDPKLVEALGKTLAALKDDKAHPIPSRALAALAPLARPGLELNIDLEASQEIGAPLVTLTENNGEAAMLAKLTRRQKEVAALVIAGSSNRDIASELCISIATVKDHVHAILHRLELPSRAALIAAARTPSQG